MTKSARAKKPSQVAKSLDLMLVLGAPWLAAAITIFFQTSQIISLLLFFILPAAYLTFKKPWIFKKAVIPLICSVPFVMIVDHFAIKDGSWWVNTIFPFRLLNNIPIEDFIWTASWFYFIVAFYEYFIDQPRAGKDCTTNHRYQKVMRGWFISGFGFLLFYSFIDQFIFIPYFYAWFTLVLGLIPTAWLLTRRPWLLRKFTPAMLYFFMVNFLHEISALATNQWYFPGNHFIGWVQIMQFRLPFEEFSLWMLLGSTCLLTWYEYFEDDGR